LIPLIPYQFEIVTTITAVLVGVILTVYILVLKKNGWIGKTPIETALPNNNLQRQSKSKAREEPTPTVIETEVAISKQETKEMETSIEMEVPIAKSQENKKFKRKNHNKEVTLKKEQLEGCNNYFGYLWTLSKGINPPDECYCCSKLIECYKERKE
jgi:hypothetical protein